MSLCFIHHFNHCFLGILLFFLSSALLVFYLSLLVHLFLYLKYRIFQEKVIFQEVFTFDMRVYRDDDSINNYDK